MPLFLLTQPGGRRSCSSVARWLHARSRDASSLRAATAVPAKSSTVHIHHYHSSTGKAAAEAPSRAELRKSPHLCRELLELPTTFDKKELQQAFHRAALKYEDTRDKPPTSFFCYSRTLMGCTDPPYRGSAHPNSALSVQ